MNDIIAQSLPLVYTNAVLYGTKPYDKIWDSFLVVFIQVCQSAMTPSPSMFQCQGGFDGTLSLSKISRCYKVWGAKKKIIAFPVLLSIINNGFALLELSSVIKTELSPIVRYAAEIFLAINFSINLVIPLMIAGRVWWIGHQVAKFLPTGYINLRRRTIAVCLESGVMYPLALIPVLVFVCQKSPDFDVYVYAYIPILAQIVGIAPTFIIFLVHFQTTEPNPETKNDRKRNFRDFLLMTSISIYTFMIQTLRDKKKSLDSLICAITFARGLVAS
ncbi:hypothetical protein K435DRAFT_909211 [Dendrothele bispora CBS 962.96]|uniref:Uncharacterized protein n=1 Tax=Dendrothele bispora (strain CBS 962.96) TaxID=1314807 RepID=A0A4S8LPC9_DENBC|nr:hypothetical protein K435DRAFT_909211 [Dendrothele bispora CBS 962.96]